MHQRSFAYAADRRSTGLVALSWANSFGAFALSLLLLASAGCERGDPPDDGFLLIEVVSEDVAGTPLEGLQSLRATVTRVEIIHRTDLADPATEQRLTVLDTEQPIEFVGLEAGVPRRIAVLRVPPGHVLQVRLVEASGDSIEMTISGETFPVKLPSGPQTGLKIVEEEDGSFPIASRETTAIRVNFDPNEQVIQNRGIGFILKPVIRARVVALESLLPYRAGELIVRFQDDIDSAEGAAILADEGFVEILRHDPEIHYFLARLPEPDPEQTVTKWLDIRDRGDVRYALPNFNVRTTLDPGDPEFSTQVELLADRVDVAWDALVPAQRGNRRVVVAVADTGVALAHPDLFENIWINVGELPLALASPPGAPPADFDGDGVITFADLNNPPDAAAAALLSDNGIVDTTGLAGVIDAFDLIAAVAGFSDRDGDGNADDDGSGKADDIVGWDFVDEDNNPFDSGTDQQPRDDIGADCVVDDTTSHGTAMGGLIAAITGNALQIASPTFGVRLLPARVLGGQTGGLDPLNAAMRYIGRNQALFGVQVASLSIAAVIADENAAGLGVVREQCASRCPELFPDEVPSQAISPTAKYDKGRQDLTDNVSDWGLGSYLLTQAVSNCDVLDIDDPGLFVWPAETAAGNMVRVGNVNPDRELLSAFGPTTIDLAATGAPVTGTFPLLDFEGATRQFANGGSSSATAHTAGVAALTIASDPGTFLDNPGALRARLLDTATRRAELEAFVSGGRVLDALCAVNPADPSCP
jgi:subtilisin family serine protease